MANHLNVAIAERAGQQLGLITREQLIELGATPSQVRGLTGSGLLVPRSRAVFAHLGFPESNEQRWLAAAWSAGPGAVVSHLAAAAIWSFDGISDRAVEVTVPEPRRARSVTGRVHRSRDLVPADVTTKGLIPVTTPARTLFDAAQRLQPCQLEEALDGACRRGQIHLAHLAWRLEELRRSGRPGVAKLEALLAAARTERGEESWLESAFIRLLRDARLPLPKIQMVVLGVGEGRRYRLDGCYEAHKLAVEVDGHATHATRRKRQADAERHRHLVAAGFRVVTFVYEDVKERPTDVAASVAGFLGIVLPR